MPIQVRGVLVHAISGTELSRVRTEFQLRLPEPINKSPLESRGADIVMQSSEIEVPPNLVPGFLAPLRIHGRRQRIQMR